MTAEPVNYIQEVPDHCDRIIWRGRYYHLENMRANAPSDFKPTPADMTMYIDCYGLVGAIGASSRRPASLEEQALYAQVKELRGEVNRLKERLEHRGHRG